MRKLIFPLMGIVWALCLATAPPLIAESQAQLAMQSHQDATPVLDLAPASLAYHLKGLVAAPVDTNPGTATISFPLMPSLSRAGPPLAPGHLQHLVWYRLPGVPLDGRCCGHSRLVT